MKKYKRINQQDREIIERRMKEGKNVREIAEEIGVHYTTVYNELRRCNVTKRLEGYSAEQAQRALQEGK